MYASLTLLLPPSGLPFPKELSLCFCKEQAARISNKGKFSTDSKGKPASRPQVNGQRDIFLYICENVPV